MARFTLTTPEDRLNLARCVLSGQLFRWSVNGNLAEGWDGDSHYSVRIEGETYHVDGDRHGFSRLFQLDRDERDIEARIVAAAPEMVPSMARLRGLRVLNPQDPTEVFFSFLCSANNHLPRITSMVQTLAALGSKGFPRVAEVAQIEESCLRELRFGYRAATIMRAAREVESRGGERWLADLAEIGYGEAWARLMEVPGVGPKLADCICLYGLHYGEAVPIDTHLWQAATRTFFPDHTGKPLTAARYREIGDFFRSRFGDLAGWAHLYLYYDDMLTARSRP